ncbi:MAG: hypothetical protein KTR14_04065 [Vampirovibrio sp.]|nr:hypothetical protein [Vampirovibrio sp.]
MLQIKPGNIDPKSLEQVAGIREVFDKPSQYAAMMREAREEGFIDENSPSLKDIFSDVNDDVKLGVFLASAPGVFDEKGDLAGENVPEQGITLHDLKVIAADYMLDGNELIPEQLRLIGLKHGPSSKNLSEDDSKPSADQLMQEGIDFTLGLTDPKQVEVKQNETHFGESEINFARDGGLAADFAAYTAGFGQDKIDLLRGLTEEQFARVIHDLPIVAQFDVTDEDDPYKRINKRDMLDAAHTFAAVVRVKGVED